MSETTGFFGSSKNRAFIARSLVQRGLSGHGFNLSAAGGCEHRLEQCDIVHELVGGDRIALDAANGAGEGDEVVLHRLGGRNLAGRDRAAGLCGRDDPAVGRFDMRLVANLDPAFRAIDRETRYERVGERGRNIGCAAAPKLDVGGDGVALRQVGRELFANAPARFRPGRAGAPKDRADGCPWRSSRPPEPGRLSGASCPGRAPETCRG